MIAKSGVEASLLNALEELLIYSTATVRGLSILTNSDLV